MNGYTSDRSKIEVFYCEKIIRSKKVVLLPVNDNFFSRNKKRL